MGLFGKLLEKKNCDICGEEIKLLGNKKLEDGNLCKSCASKLSPWFDDRRHSTVQQIREQLDYREANRSRVQAFNTTLSIGNSGMKLLADENARVFMVTGSRDFAKDNPDVVDFSHITGCDLDIRENRNELKQKVDGKSVSYNPPRYEYSYDFHAEIRVNEPWFDKMRFPLNSGSVRTGERCMTGAATSGWRVKADGIGMRERMATEEYYKYIDMGNDLKERVEEWRSGSAAQTRQQSAYTTLRLEPEIPYHHVEPAVPAGLDVFLKVTAECDWHVEDSSLWNDVGSEDILSQRLETKLMSALFAYSSNGVPYDQLPARSAELFGQLSQSLFPGWRETFGVAADAFRISSVTLSESAAAVLEKCRRMAEFRDPTKAEEALRQAMNQAEAAALQSGSWTCGCGATNTGKFCEYCGSPRP